MKSPKLKNTVASNHLLKSVITKELNLMSNINHFGNVKINTQVKTKLLLKILQAILL